jgi:membrane protease YdiL (CAAX protease family)
VRHGQWWALSVASVLFGLAHAGGGPIYVALATVAGAGYGWAYLRTGKIEASILTHFALNAVHFFGFTYPALQAAR